MGTNDSAENRTSGSRYDSLNSNGYVEFDKLSEADRRAMFNAAAQSRGILPTNTEKDFWLCRILCVLMKGPPPAPKRFLKGGTSLSKGFGLIERFSEDIDIVLSRKGLIGSKYPDPTDPKIELSNNQRKRLMSDLRKTSRKYVYITLKDSLDKFLPEIEIVEDRTSHAEHVLMIKYISIFPPDDSDEGEYTKREIKIDAGVRGADEPPCERDVQPYIQDFLGETIDLVVRNITMVKPERTFWEKITAIHNVNNCFAVDGIKPTDRQFVARHYYDVATISAQRIGREAMGATDLLNDVREYGSHVFPERSRYNHSAELGTLSLVPMGDLAPIIARDYQRMQGMMYQQPPPPFEWIIRRLTELENELNNLQPLPKAAE